MKNDIRIDDEHEFMKQKEAYILESKKFVELKILVGHDDSVPISVLHGEGVSIEDFARLIRAIQNQLNYIVQECPEAFIIAEQMVSTNFGNIMQKGEEKDEK